MTNEEDRPIEILPMCISASAIQGPLVAMLKQGRVSEAALIFPEMTLRQAAALVSGLAKLEGNSAEGVRVVL